VDHIIARQHGGLTKTENLALACRRCNMRKDPNIAGSDPDTGRIIRLLNPRIDLWPQLFEWLDAAIAGRTPIGRTTIQVLDMNEPDRCALREALMADQLFPLD
jgi:hypothetical protein